ARGAAERSLGDLFEDSGRQLVVAGDPARALPLLVEALRHRGRAPSLDFLLGRALAPLAPLEAVLAPHEGLVTALAFLPDGRVASVATDFVLRVFDGPRLAAALPGAMFFAVAP